MTPDSNASISQLRSHWPCHWNWCREAFITQTQLLRHVNAHLAEVKPMRRRDARKMKETRRARGPPTLDAHMLLVQQTQSTGNTNPLIPVSPEKPSQPPLNEDFASMEPSPPVLLVPQTQSTEHTTSSAAASPEKQPHLPSKVGSASASERAPVLLVAQTRSTESTTPSAPVSPEKSSGLLGSGTDRLNAPIEIMVTKTLIVRSDGDVIPEQQIVTDSSQPREYGNEIDEYSEEELLAQMDEEDRSSAIAHSPIASQQGTPSPSPSPTSEPEPVLSRAVAILSAPNDHHLSNTTSPLLAPVAAPISLQTSPQPTTTKTTLEAPKLPTRFSFTSMAGPGTPSPLPLPPSPSPGTLLQAARLGRARGSWALAPFVHPPSSPSPQKPQSNKRMRGSSESPIAGYPMYGDSSSSLTPATKGLMMVSTTTPTSGEAEASPTARKRQRRFATNSPVLSASPLPPGAVKWASELYGENNENIQQDQLTTTTTTTTPPPRPTTLFVDLATQAPPLESDGLSQAYSQWDGLSPGIADGSINDELSSQVDAGDMTENALLDDQDDGEGDDLEHETFLDDYVDIERLGFQTQPPREESGSYEDGSHD